MANLPIRFDYYQYCVETWKKIFARFSQKKLQTITDLCPGWSPKIEIALFRTNYSGIVNIIDKVPGHIDTLVTLVRSFPINFKLKPVVTDLLGPIITKIPPADLVVANHIIDDLLIDLYQKTKKTSHNNIFEDPDTYLEICQKIIKSPNLQDTIIHKLQNRLLHLINPSGYLLITQYQGYQEKLYSQNHLHQFYFETTRKLVQKLISQNHFSVNRKLITPAFKNLPNPYFQPSEIFCLQKPSS